MSTAETSFADALFLACQLNTKGNKKTATGEEYRQVLSELKAAEKIIAQFSKVFHNPCISSAKLKSFLEVFEGQLSRVPLEFLYILALKRRLKLLPGICEKFETLLIRETGLNGDGELHVKLTFPYEPENALIEKMRESLPKSGLYPESAKPYVKFQVAVDPSLIAGFVAEANGLILDVSLLRKLSKRR
ncbi:MAG: ATP synthase F1 subunit delta [Oscillospiraceae bacterium]|jgi:ATP synthase F1 delta subunit|nr:ATP synthase F1 subunit delta [Oscillospiraceae bacterium]